jgi:hypothetical protein
VIIRIGFIGCLVGLFSSGGGDRYVSALISIVGIVATPVFTFIEGWMGWNGAAPAFSLIGDDIGGGIARGSEVVGGEAVGGEVIGGEVVRGVRRLLYVGVS